MRVASTLLSPEEVGKVSLVVATTAFFALFFVSPVGMFLNRRLHSWQINGVARHYFFYYLYYLLLVSILAAVFLYFLQIYGWLNIEIRFVWLATLVCGSIFFSTITLTAIPSLNLLGNRKIFLILSIAMAASSLLCSILFVYLNDPVAHYWLVGQLIGQTFIGVIGVNLLLKFLRNSKKNQAPMAIYSQQLQALFRFAWPVALAAGLYWVQAQGYRYVLESKLGLMQLGFFVAGYGISAGLISGFESILTTYFQPRLYRDVSMGNLSDQGRAWRIYASSVTPLLVLTVAFILMLAPELTHLFLGENFQSSEKYLIWGGLAECARVLIGVYSLIAHVFMRTKWLIVPNVIGAVSSILFCTLLIPEYGAAGVGMGLVASGFLVVLAMHFLLMRYAAGGFSIRPTLVAFLFALVLWVVTVVTRQLLVGNSHFSHILQIGLIGIPYLGMQYLLVRNYINNSNLIS